ncbi:DUF2628 domain-containing protein [Candidatus Thioglobus sp.]|nr:DUF2628 domain-containing protein [Candidatus Thioglobus sp.]
METFQIYDRDDSEPVAVKYGWSWPAFFFTWLWAANKGLWIPWLVIVAIVFLSPALEEIATLLPNIGGFAWLIILAPNLIFGSEGNEWLGNKLTKKGYRIEQTIEADDAKEALFEYNGNESREKEARIKVKETREFFKRASIKKVRITKHTPAATNENTTVRKPLPSKISSQTLFIRQKREINRKLKQKLITKKTADTQMKKAAELEEMRLIIENKGKKPEVKKAIKVKKITAKSSDDFDYVEKLKDITTLREEGAISQAEFRKLKKKIMDTI